MMFPANHGSYIRALYKNILCEGSLFFDDCSRAFIRDRARSTFKEYKRCQDLERVKTKIREARKKLHRIEDANRGDQKSAFKILLEVYGRRGRVRHELLDPYLNHYKPADFKMPEPLVAHVAHTAPPPALCSALCVLITQHLGKRTEPTLPEPAFKPLHPGRKANLLWKHRSMLLERVQVPLPFETVCALEQKAGAPAGHPLSLQMLARGGPPLEFYALRQLLHLRPPVRAPQSKFRRTRTLRDLVSPYEAQPQPSLLSYLEPEPQRPIGLTAHTPVYNERQQKRLYRRLLDKVPCIDHVSGATLWQAEMKPSLTRSHWAVRSVHQLLPDVPEPEVIKATLQGKKK
ncbi:hypothetical protein BY458DRAFT_43251 [Sporodiniella umbellata]|nr:hypothetical protein BY458DRAFT_43251 [Sporodiniella umbellata]